MKAQTFLIIENFRVAIILEILKNLDPIYTRNASQCALYHTGNVILEQKYIVFDHKVENVPTILGRRIFFELKQKRITTESFRAI